MSDSSEKKGSQFGLGLLVGFLTGSTAYFLLNTEKGEQLRQELRQKWQTAKEEAPALDELKIGDLPLKEVINILLFGESHTDLSAGSQPKLEIKDAKRGKAGRAHKPKKFKGV